MLWLSLPLSARFLPLCLGLTLAVLLVGYAMPKQVIAFVSDRDGSYKIYLIDSAHNLMRQLSDLNVAACCLSWSPDGAQIIVPVLDDSNVRLYRMNRNGSELHLLTNDVTWSENNAVWSPGGQKVAFMRNPNLADWEIAVIDLLSGATQQLTDNTADDVMPIWSPDEQYILFTSNQGSSNAIYRINLDGSGRRSLTDNPFHNVAVAFSPDGQSILFSVADRIGNADIYVMNADGSGYRRLTSGAVNNFSAYAPDGRQIVFVSTRDGEEEIYVMYADGTDQTQLTDNDSLDWLPSWSPDGQQILFLSQRDGNTELYLMDADGQNQRRLTDHPALDTYPAWQP